MRIWVVGLTAALLAGAVPGRAMAEGAHRHKDHGNGSCPDSLWFRTPLQVWQSHLAAIQAGNVQAIACDYAEDATVIMAGNVINGRDNIVNGLIAFQLQLGALPTVTSVTSSGLVVYIEYTLQTPHLIIPDGADTYVVVLGHIQYQTVHATFEPQ